MVSEDEPSEARESSYQYQPLDQTKNEIRLLKILPIRRVDGKEYDTVECSLFVISLDSSTEYDALSYTWGDASNLREISLDGQPFKVTPNLEDALWHLQSHDRVKIFWIDALCINQNDDRERSAQVGKMRTIYERAKNVAI
jgi:hypothetical protein